MKILHLNRFFFSGQTTHVFALVSEQQKQGHLAHLVIDGYPSQQALQIYKKRIRNLGVISTKPNDKGTLLNLFEKYDYDIIHTHSALTHLTAAELSEKFRKPYVITCHAAGLEQAKYHNLLDNASALFCISERLAGNFTRYAAKTHVVPNGVDLEEFKPGIKTEPVKIALVARIDPRKNPGYEHFCKAADLLENIEFCVAANKSPQSGTAKFLGWTDNIGELLCKTDIVVGTGRSIVEGLAAGNAAIILGETYQGVLTPESVVKQSCWDLSGLSGSDPCYKTILFDLVKLVQTPSYLKKLQAYGRELACEFFDNRKITETILRVYEQVK